MMLQESARWRFGMRHEPSTRVKKEKHTMPLEISVAPQRPCIRRPSTGDVR